MTRGRQRRSRITGILNVNKPVGITSHDVVSAVRRASHQRRVGHAGTLDPMATGVLLICMGKATRLSEYLMEGTKEYRATIRFGITTDTYDATGEVVSRADEFMITRQEAERAAEAFIGQIKQVPPMYSAIKRQGEPLYRLARQGIEVERDARPVEIHDLVFVEWEYPLATIDVTCSKGTYIRSLAHDLGQALGSGAHLAALTRTRSGSFRIEGAVPLQELVDAFDGNAWSEYLVPMGAALERFPAWTVDAETAGRIQQGQQVEGPLPAELVTPPADGEREEALCRAYTAEEGFIAVLRHVPDTNLWQPEKVFVD